MAAKTQHRLTNLRIDEISLVDRPANPDARVALVKRAPESAGETPTTPQEETVMSTPTETVEKAPETVEKAETVTISKAQMESIEKALKDTQEMLAKSEARALAAEAVAKAEAERRETEEFTKRAEALKSLPGVSTADLGALLLTISKAVPAETFEALETVLKAAHEALATGETLAETGTASTAASVSGDPIEKLTALGNEIAKAEGCTPAQGFVKAYERNPELGEAYRKSIRG